MAGGGEYVIIYPLLKGLVGDSMKMTCSNERGVSLIEVLVVLVVLLVGIMSAIRVFPIGFGVIQHSRDLTRASRLAETELASWTQNPEDLPAGILPVSGDYDLPKKDNYNEFRKVIGESTIVGGDDNVSGNGSFYLFRLGPVETSPSMQGVYPYKDSIRTAALTQMPYSKNTYLDLASANTSIVSDIQKYQIDESTDKPRLYFTATPYRTYLFIEYEYYDQSGARRQFSSDTTSATLEGKINPSTDQEKIESIDLPTNSDYESLVPGSVKVYRSVELVNNFSGNGSPFEFMVNRNLLDYGAVSFNPRLQGTRVYMNYVVKDWEILHEDLRVSDTGTLNLTVPFIKDPNSGASIKSGYNGVLGNGDVVDIVTLGGATLGSPSSSVTPGTTEIFTQGSLSQEEYRNDLKNGIIPVSSIPQGALVRVYYRAEDDWAMQLSRAYDRYVTADSSVSVLDPGFYKMTDPETAGTDEWRPKLLLPLCDAGKSVVADVRVLDTSTNPATVLADRSSMLFVADKFATNGNVVATTGSVVIKITGYKGNPVVQTYNVRGVSVKVAVTWKGADHIRSREVDTILNR